MPAKNAVKALAQGHYYHIYNRGVAKQVIFHDSQDKKYFLKIIDRHLNPANDDKRSDGVLYEKFDEDFEMLAYCLMGNHFHFLLYINGEPAKVKEFMRGLSAAYTVYYNKKYRGVGHIFQGIYKASRITSQSYLTHISRYIHLNPRNYRNYFYSSLGSYLGDVGPGWLKKEHLLAEFKDSSEYLQFLEDYEDRRDMLEEIKHELADQK